MQIDWQNVMNHAVVPAAVAAIGLVVNYLLPKLPGATGHLFDYLKSRTAGMKNLAMRNLLDHVITLAGQKVMALEQTEVAFIQEQLAAGKLTKDQLPAMMAGIKQKAIDAVRNDLSAQGLFPQITSLFSGSPDAFVKWLDAVIESQVGQLPASGVESPRVAPSAQSPAPQKTA